MFQTINQQKFLSLRNFTKSACASSFSHMNHWGWIKCCCTRCPEQWKENQEQRHHKSKSGWWFQPLRKILVSWDDYSKPPTRNSYGLSLTKMSETMRDISGELPFDDILGIINISSTVTVDTIAVHYPHRIWKMTKVILESWLYDLKIHDEKPWINCHTLVYYLTSPKKWTV